MLNGSLNLGGLIQTGETLAANFTAGLGNLAAGFQGALSGAIQTGETLAANLLASLPGLPALTFPNLGSLGVELSAALNGLGASLNASLNAALNGSLNLGPNLNGLIQAGETLAGNFGANLGNLAAGFTAGLSGAIQTGETLAANFLASLPGLPALTLP